MNSPNEDGTPSYNPESRQQGAACCGAGCSCNKAGTPGKAHWVFGVIVLIAAGVMVVRAMSRGDTAAAKKSAEGFAAPAVSVTPSDTNAIAPVVEAETSVGLTIGALSELNTVAAQTDSVLVYLPGKDGTTGLPPVTPMKAAARVIEAKGLKCGLFTLKPGARDYEQFGRQLATPAVLAMVKGRGMSAVSGEITDTKLVQAFVGASSSGGCGPSAGSGCCPK